MAAVLIAMLGIWKSSTSQNHQLRLLAADEAASLSLKRINNARSMVSTVDVKADFQHCPGLPRRACGQRLVRSSIDDNEENPSADEAVALPLKPCNACNSTLQHMWVHGGNGWHAPWNFKWAKRPGAGFRCPYCKSVERDIASEQCSLVASSSNASSVVPWAT